MSLHPARVLLYICGALTAACTALAVGGGREAGARRWLAVGVALVCGALAVAYEERAQRS